MNERIKGKTMTRNEARRHHYGAIRLGLIAKCQGNYKAWQKILLLSYHAVHGQIQWKLFNKMLGRKGFVK